MMAFENRNGLICSYNTATKEFRRYATPEEAREHFDSLGIATAHYYPDAPWRVASPAGDASRESDFRHSAGTSAASNLSGLGKWSLFPVSWIGDGESIEARLRG